MVSLNTCSGNLLLTLLIVDRPPGLLLVSIRFYNYKSDYQINKRLLEPLAMSSREPHNPARRSRSPQTRRCHKRSRSPTSHHHHHVSRKHKRSKPLVSVHLPLQASKLDKYDYEAFKPMFELYLDIQKQKVLEELSDDEVKGRWKSFVGKWYISARSL